MDTELLKTFLEVRKTRHFGRAADNLCLTQAAVSARIRQLEQLLGVALFQRNRNNIQLTEAGERLVAHAQSVVAVWALARAEVGARGDLNRPLRIASSAAAIPLAQCLSQLRQQLPEQVWWVRTGIGSSAVEQLLSGQLDMLVGYDLGDLAGVEVRSLGRTEIALYSSKREQQFAEQGLADYVGVNWGQGFTAFQQRHCAALSAGARLWLDDAEAALQMVRKMGALAYLGEELAGRYPRSLHRVMGAPVYEAELQLAAAPGSEFGAAVDAVQECLQLSSGGD